MLRHLVLATVLLLPLAAPAGVLYKSVDEKGTVTFSDVPPAQGARVLEARAISPSGTLAAAPAAATAAPAMDPLLAQFEVDAAVARANAQLDQAERELALARRDLLSPREGLRLVDRRMTPADDARIEFFKRNVAAARHALMDLLRDRRNQLVSAAVNREPGAPRYYAAR